MELDDDERAQLIATFACEPDELVDVLRRFAKAAEEEYLRMILGQRVLSRGQDIREYRLFLMIVHAMDNQLPTEQKISALFQTTTTQSRALLRAVMSKYQYELQVAVDNTVGATLKDATQKHDDTWHVTVDSENVIEVMNRRLAAIDGTLPQVTRARGTVTTYEIANSSYLKLTGQ